MGMSIYPHSFPHILLYKNKTKSNGYFKLFFYIQNAISD